jgi:hypothetical protein
MDFSDMDRLEKTKYSLSVFAGDELSGKLAEIQVRRVDGDEISEDEVEDLLDEFEELFPSDTYKLLHETKPLEDDVILHVYVSLEKEERLRRTKGALGERVIVPKTEVEKRLKSW